ncbi:hypothetical protein BDZ94DRAFT_1230553 [Collybia nuda]|uniref:Uncharacterized protein n=1 Tax=Collybia nuda TaxID=64659 RepID=A0A9P6CB87_9AGAR|nr:hypothetical protein BDZ94DRAFT_1230553 [Collybia nuda]
MTLRTFTVFQDAPTSDTPKHTASSAVLSTSLSVLANSANPNNATTLTTAEKENLHPLTGERAGPSITNSKKRKTSVLATKVHLPLGSKALKEAKEAQPDAKKRKSSSTSTAKSKSASTKKDGKPSSSSSSSARKAAKKPSRRVSPMPKLNEEVEADGEQDRIIQVDIDSRCYELTVKPLADVSQAYEQSASAETLGSCGENVKFQAVKESSVEPEIRDFFSTAPAPSTCPVLGSTLPPIVRLSDGGDQTFSTPERKKIYAAFTFTSPSPTSERFSKAKRAGSVPRLELV